MKRKKEASSVKMSLMKKEASMTSCDRVCATALIISSVLHRLNREVGCIHEVDNDGSSW